MKRFSFIAPALLVLSLAGCIFDHDDSGDRLRAERYFPLKENTSWTYRDTYGNGLEGTSTLAITGKKTQEGHEYAVFCVEGTETENYFRIENNVVYVYMGNTAALPLPENSQRRRAAMPAFVMSAGEHEWPYFDFSAKIGDTWEIYRDKLSLVDAVTDVVITGKLTTGAVEVESGSYGDCAIFAITTVRETVYSDNRPARNEKNTVTWWLARDIGLVKQTQEIQSGDNPPEIIESELLYYSVPF
ncbi:hypothetical protein LLG96_03885 [bacterium]|nr:hypothetical protein [bacterium]